MGRMLLKSKYSIIFKAAAIVLGLALPVWAGEQAASSFKEKLFTQMTDPWVVFGFAAQFMFMMRFVLQWLASEKRQKSYVPVAFWYFSLAGGLMLFSYAVRQQDPVFIFGQGLGCFIYIRNLVLIYRRKAALSKARKARSNQQGSLVDLIFEKGREQEEAVPVPAQTVRDRA
jgi:lipid-A-disaccharide synthase-like uncharacterized protein